jgi:hypothetical protein
MSRKKPLHYYIKHPNELLTKGIEGIHSVFSRHGTERKILSAVYEKERIHINDLKNLMHPHVDPITVNSILAKLVIQCIIFNAEDKITLTSNGMDFYKSCCI